MSENVRAAIRSYILTNFLPGADPSELVDDALLREGIVDSIGRLKLVQMAEEFIGREIAPSEFKESFDTINHIVAFVDKCRNG